MHTARTHGTKNVTWDDNLSIVIVAIVLPLVVIVVPFAVVVIPIVVIAALAAITSLLWLSLMLVHCVLMVHDKLGLEHTVDQIISHAYSCATCH